MDKQLIEINFTSLIKGILIIAIAILTISIHAENDEANGYEEFPPSVAFSGVNGILREVFVLNLQTSEITNISQNPYNDQNVSWNPKTPQLAFNSNRNGDEEVFVYDFQTDSLVNMTNLSESDELSPDWFDSGDSIIFTSDKEERNDIYRLDLISGEILPIVSNISRDQHATLLPNDIGIAFSSSRGSTTEFNFNLYYMLWDQDPILLIEDEFSDLYNPEISPDYQYLAYSVYGRKSHINLYDFETGTHRNISDLTRDANLPSWSPDSHCIAYDYRIDAESEGIYVYDLRTNTEIAIEIEMENVTDLVWSPATTCDDLLEWSEQLNP